MRSVVVLLALAGCSTSVDTDSRSVAPLAPGQGASGALDDADALPAAGADQASLPDLRLGPDAPLGGEVFASDRVIVGTFGPAPATLDLGGVKLTLLDAFAYQDGGVYAVADGATALTAVQAGASSALVRYVELDPVRRASADTYRSYQWHFDEVNAETAWTMSTGAGAVVAVIDSGVKPGGPDGIGTLLAGYDWVGDDTDPSDANGHGTHVAGTIAQRTNNGTGVAGLAPGAAILPLRVLDAQGNGFTSDVVLAVEYAITAGADVINMSLGGGSYTQAEADAMAAAWAAGIFVAAASGNAGASAIDYPAAYPYVVSVGATGFGGALAPYSNRGTGLDLVAPGGNTSVDANGDGYVDGVLQETFSGTTWGYYFFQGTSMATPHVAASAALLASAGATNDQALTLLKQTAIDLGAAGPDSSYGSGLIQPDDALAALLSGTPNTPPVAVAGGPYTAAAGTAITLSGTGSSDPDGSVVSWAWTFGDGTTGSGATPSKSWSAAGTYTVTLTVTDNRGGTASASTTATVSGPACAFSGSISSGSRTHALGALASGTPLDERLTWTTTSANLDFQLQAAAPGSTRWSTVASSASKTAGVFERIVYTVPTNRNNYSFRWNVVRKSGSTTYCIGD